MDHSNAASEEKSARLPKGFPLLPVTAFPEEVTDFGPDWLASQVQQLAVALRVVATALETYERRRDREGALEARATLRWIADMAQLVARRPVRDHFSGVRSL